MRAPARWLAITGTLLMTGAAAARANTEDPRMRSMAYTLRTAAATRAWQRDLRARLFRLLALDDLLARRSRIPLRPRELTTGAGQGCRIREVEISATGHRRFTARVTTPDTGSGPWPAVVCIHGHGGTRASTYERDSIYKGFASAMAAQGYVTIAADVGQHEIAEVGRTLMGERLWDLMRCVDYLRTISGVDPARIGCAGLSLGGEMAMWLGAMDPRVCATASCGFLTRMDQMEQNHCMCWKFDGLRELVDFADIYAMTAPRALLFQNGEGEPANQFPPSIARELLPGIQAAYASLGFPGNVMLVAHGGAHEVDLPSLMGFMETHLRAPAPLPSGPGVSTPVP